MPNPYRGSRYGSVDGSDYVMSAVACSGFLTFQVIKNENPVFLSKKIWLILFLTHSFINQSQ